MAYIKDIRFDSVDRKDGLVCDRCGAYIRNIYTGTYSDGLVARYGMECFKKLFDAGKLTDFGRKLMMKEFIMIALIMQNLDIVNGVVNL